MMSGNTPTQSSVLHNPIVGMSMEMNNWGTAYGTFEVFWAGPRINAKVPFSQIYDEAPAASLSWVEYTLPK